MVNKQRKPALYEAISKSRQKTTPAGPVEPLRQPRTDEHNELQNGDPMRTEPLEWPRKRKLIWFSNKRVEISIAYSLAVAILLAVIVVVLFAFRLGQQAGAN